MIADHLRSKRNGVGEPATLNEQGLQQVASKLTEQSKQVVQIVQQTIREHPGISLGIAASIGIALGWWMKRR